VEQGRDQGGLLSYSIEHGTLEGVSVVSLTGDIDLYAAPQLADCVAEALRAGGGRLVFDLTETTFIDSTTLGIVMRARRRLEARGGELRVVCPDASIAELFAIVGLDQLIPMDDALPNALAALGERA
jgi:anti-sigma B factor antagonist